MSKKIKTKDLKKNSLTKSFATGIIIVFILALFIWTLDPNMREQVLSYIKGSNSFVTVNGEDVLTPYQMKAVVEQRNVNFGNYPDALVMQIIKNYREVNQLISKKVLIEYSKDIGLVLSPEAKQRFAIELYKKAKRQYELRYNMRYQVPYEQFFEMAEEQYLSSLVNSSITQGILISKAEAALKYKMENTRRQVDYVIFNFTDYMKTVRYTNKELKNYYNSQEASSFRSNMRNKVRAYAIWGTDKEKMTKLHGKISRTPGLFEKKAKEQNVRAQDYTITKATRDIAQIRQVSVGKYSRLIKRVVNGQTRYYIFKIIKHYPRQFNELRPIDLKELSQVYAKSSVAKQKYQKKFKNKAKSIMNEIKMLTKQGQNFHAVARARGLKIGTTEFFPVSLKDTVDNTIHDPVQNTNRKPIKIFGSKNRTLFKKVFKMKINEVSDVMHDSFTSYYMVKLKGIKKPNPIDAANYKKYIIALKKRHQSEIRARVIRSLFKKYKVKWHEDNIIKLVRAIHGRSS